MVPDVADESGPSPFAFVALTLKLYGWAYVSAAIEHELPEPDVTPIEHEPTADPAPIFAYAVYLVTLAPPISVDPTRRVQLTTTKPFDELGVTLGADGAVGVVEGVYVPDVTTQAELPLELPAFKRSL